LLLPPLLRAASPFLRNLNPLLSGLGLYKHDVTATFANVAAATNAVHLGSTGRRIHYLRALGPLGPESVSTYPNRLTINRSNAYPQPLSGKRLAQGLLSFETRQCSSGITATLDPESPNNPDFNTRDGGDVEKATDFFERLKQLAFAGQESTATVPAPGCEAQGPFEPIYGGEPPTAYLHTFEQPE